MSSLISARRWAAAAMAAALSLRAWAGVPDEPLTLREALALAAARSQQLVANRASPMRLSSGSLATGNWALSCAASVRPMRAMQLAMCAMGRPIRSPRSHPAGTSSAAASSAPIAAGWATATQSVAKAGASIST